MNMQAHAPLNRDGQAVLLSGGEFSLLSGDMASVRARLGPLKVTAVTRFSILGIDA